MPYLGGEAIGSCGCASLVDIHHKPKENVYQIAKQNEDWEAAFVVWSDVLSRDSNGNKLYHYIRRHFPKSSVTRTKKAKNPNSGNQIAVYVWRLPRKKLKSWAKQVDKEKEEKRRARRESRYTGVTIPESSFSLSGGWFV
jgi:hypothetical protein